MLYLAIGGIGLQELLPILIIVLVLFGAKKLPELARAMGSSINQFKKGLSDAETEEQVQLTEKGQSKPLPGKADEHKTPRDQPAVVDEERSRVP